jgi:hypothetical protein
MLFGELEHLIRTFSLESAALSKIWTTTAAAPKFFDCLFE